MEKERKKGFQSLAPYSFSPLLWHLHAQEPEGVNKNEFGSAFSLLLEPPPSSTISICDGAKKTMGIHRRIAFCLSYIKWQTICSKMIMAIEGKEKGEFLLIYLISFLFLFIKAIQMCGRNTLAECRIDLKSQHNGDFEKKVIFFVR